MIELIQDQYNFIQLLNNLFKVGSLVYLQHRNVKKSKKID